MTINIWPYNVVANEGCFYWGWYVAAEIQIFVFLIFFIWLLEVQIGRKGDF